MWQVNQKDCEIGVGQHAIISKRAKLIEYLPWMFVYINGVQSKKAEQISNTLDTLIFPFDKYIWLFTITFTMAVFILLIFIQKCWIHASGQKPPDGWIFQGDIASVRTSVDFCNNSQAYFQTLSLLSLLALTKLCPTGTTGEILSLHPGELF